MDNALVLFERLVSGKYSSIRGMIDQKQEETLFLDFKLKKDEKSKDIKGDDKKNYSKALSGFSNASGGVIVWGVYAGKGGDDDLDVAKEERPISYLKNFLTIMNNLTSDAITPYNPGIRNEIIYLNDDANLDQGFLVTYVPESGLPPHQAKLGENRYYIRIGDSFVVMEHHMLEDAFGKRQKPKLEIKTWMQQEKDINLYPHKFSIIVAMKNTGKHLAIYPAIKIKIENIFVNTFSFIEVNGIPYHESMKPLRQSSYITMNEGQMFVSDPHIVIHPNTLLEVTKLSIGWKSSDFNFLMRAKNDALYTFSYEIFAQDYKPTKGSITITGKEILDFIRKIN